MKLTCAFWLSIFVVDASCATILSLTEERRRNDQTPWSEIDLGLASYISRPDLKPLKLNITTYDESLVSAGYWFISPYDKRIEKSHRHTFIPGQLGPHIYDGNGELVWSGSLMFKQRNSHDFRVVKHNDADALSFVEFRDESAKMGTRQSTGTILDTSYQVVHTVKANNDTSGLNMHEFNVIENGRRALVITTREQYANESKLNGGKWDGQLLQSYGFQEVDVKSGRTMFEWWAVDHVPVSDTQIKKPGRKLDFFHLNSVDKTAEGDYLISSRHTSALYLVSGGDGSVIWQLGGPHSSFVQENHLNFSSQHHARIRSQNSTHMVISFLDNASDRKLVTAEWSSAVLVSLSTATTPMTANVMRRWERPDHELSHLRGSVQILPNSNIFVGWSSYGYTSEFTYEGELLQEVRFPSVRFEDYRAYKFNFTGYSQEPIALVSHAYGSTAKATTTVFYVSWNGATEVAAWNLYTSKNQDGSDGASLLATAEKDGFETVAMIPGYHQYVFAEAISKNRTSMRNSSIEMTKPPPSSSSLTLQGNEEVVDSTELAAPVSNDGNIDSDKPDWQVKNWFLGCSAAVLIIAVWFVVWLTSRPRKWRVAGWQRIDSEDRETGTFSSLSTDVGGDNDVHGSFLLEDTDVASEVDLGSGSELDDDRFVTKLQKG